jgi:uncharacterized Zn finger protein (UPF0148 family)
MRCRKCKCPLLILIGEVRKVCARCSGVKKKARNKREYEKKKEARKQKARERYDANKESILKKQKERYAEKWARIGSILKGE